MHIFKKLNYYGDKNIKMQDQNTVYVILIQTYIYNINNY